MSLKIISLIVENFKKIRAVEIIQLWIEKVEDGGKVGIIIEDGSIKE